MKIGVIGPYPPFRGGISQFSMRLFDALSATFPDNDYVPISYRRLYPSILFPGTSQLEPGDGKKMVETEDLIDSCNPVHWASSRKFLKHSGFDNLIIQWWHPFFALSLLASIPRSIPSAAVCHNVIPHESFPFAGKLAGRFLNRMSLAVVHSSTDMKAARGLGLKAELLQLYLPIYDQYINPEITRTVSRQKLGYSDSTRLILFFGLVRSYKGVQDLVRSLSLLPEDISLLIVGECYADRNEILGIIDSLSLAERIRWIDEFVPDEDVAVYFNAADIVVLPYRHATQSAVAQIALSFKKILVLTDTGGLSELVDPGVTGYLAHPFSPSSLAESISSAFELTSDPDIASRIKRKAESFSWTSYAIELMDKMP